MMHRPLVTLINPLYHSQGAAETRVGQRGKHYDFYFEKFTLLFSIFLLVATIQKSYREAAKQHLNFKGKL